MDKKQFSKGYLITSPLKLAFHHEELIKANKGRLISPSMIRLDLTQRCYYNCTFCLYHYKDINSKSYKPELDVDFKRLLKLRKSLLRNNVKTIMIAGSGEPLLYPHFKEFLREFQDFELGIVTNGTYLDKFADSLLSSHNLKWLRISLDAATEKTWKKVHRPPKNIKFSDLINMIKKIGLDKRRKFLLGITFLILPENINEIKKVVSLFKNNEIDSIRFAPPYGLSKKDSRIIQNELKKINLAKIGDKTNIKINFSLGRFNLIPKYSTKCWAGILTPIIGTDLNIYPCCTTNYNRNFILSNLITKSFKEAWMEAYQKLRKLNNLQCKKCMYNDFNTDCKYLCMRDPEFVKFLP